MTTPHEKALEAAGQAYDKAHQMYVSPYLSHKKRGRARATPIVQAYLTSLSEQGYRVVPVKPDEQMIWDGANQLLDVHNRGPVESTRDAYAAMLAAAPQEGES